jgi:hypothetical protein
LFINRSLSWFQIREQVFSYLALIGVRRPMLQKLAEPFTNVFGSDWRLCLARLLTRIAVIGKRASSCTRMIS